MAAACTIAPKRCSAHSGHSSLCPPRALLHVTLHFLLGHPFQRQEMDHRLWNLACDIAAEEVIRELEIPSCALPDDAAQDSWRSRLRDACPHLTAEPSIIFCWNGSTPPMFWRN